MTFPVMFLISLVAVVVALLAATGAFVLCLRLNGDDTDAEFFTAVCVALVTATLAMLFHVFVASNAIYRF